MEIFKPSGARDGGQVVDAAISESIFNMLEACVPEYAMHQHDRPPSGSTISGIHEGVVETPSRTWAE